MSFNFEYKMEVELDNGLVVEINERDKTASIIKLNKKTNDVLVPRYAKYNNNKYKIISIKYSSFENVDIELLHFADDSEIEYFGSTIFYESNIKKLQIPSSLKKVDDDWLNNVKKISDFDVSPKNQQFKYEKGQFLLGKSDENSDEFDSLFYARYDIEEAVIPQQVKIVKSHSFDYHPNLKSIIFPENSKLEIIESHSFSSSPIQKLILPPSVKQIDGSNFQIVENLVDIQISPKNKFFTVFDNKYILTKSDIKSHSFDVLLFASRDIQVAQIPSQIKVISDFAIHFCKELKSITFESNSSLEKIGNSSISNNYNLTKIVFPKSVQIFGHDSLYKNDILNSIEILGNSIKLEFGCFSSCSKLTTITFPNATEIEFETSTIQCSREAKFYVLREAKLSGKGYKEIEDKINYIEKANKKENQENSTKSNENTKTEEHPNKYNDVDFLMQHIRYLERNLQEFKAVEPFNPEYDKNQKNIQDENEQNTNIFIDSEEEQEKYEIIESIGEGNTSIVFKVIDKNTLKPLCKKVLKGETSTFNDVKNAVKEFEILHSLTHPCICHAISINTQEELEEGITTIAIFIEFIDFKLTDFLKSGFASNTLKTRIVVELSHGMRYLHSKNLIYRDLNINNIMLNSIFQTKMIDFGLARMNEYLLGEETMSNYSMTKNVGNDFFMSPEMMNEEEYDNKTDVYSFGVVVYFIFFGELPKQSINDKIKRKPIKLPKESPSISKICIELISRCLSIDPKDRPTFDEIIEFLRKNKFMLSSDVDPTIVSQRDNELEIIET